MVAARQPPTAPCSMRPKGALHVAVVGSGLAGLMAARELVRQGIRVTVYEARPRVGGRVRSNRSFFKGRVIEEGAELIGSFHTKWLTLAREFGLAVVSRMEADLYKREGLDAQLILGGQRVSQQTIDELNKEIADTVLKRLALLAKQITHPSAPWRQIVPLIPPWPPYTPLTLRALDAITVERALTKVLGVRPRGEKKQFWDMLDFKLVNDEVGRLDEMNFLGLLCKVRAGQGERMSKTLPVNDNAYWDELEIFRCADGCDALAAKLVEAIEVKLRDVQLGKVHRNEAVTQIQFSKGGGVTLGLRATMANDDRASKEDVRFKDEKPARRVDGFSHVILAIPPKVWSGVRITVDQSRVDLETVIGKLTMNEAVKHFSRVGKRFWIKGNRAPHGGTSKLGQIWEGTDNQTRVEGQDIVLSVFAGPVSDGNHAPTRDVIETKELPALFSDYNSHLVRPTLFSDWPNKSFIKTGYWSPLVGEIFKVSEKLTRSHFEGRLLFAGEHTDTAFFGYMEGALRSGERAARTLMRDPCGLLETKVPEPTRVAKASRESPYFSAADEQAQDSWSGEDELGESIEDEDMPLPGAEVNTESAAEVDDEHVDAAAFD